MNDSDGPSCCGPQRPGGLKSINKLKDRKRDIQRCPRITVL